jgi:hypothetical protein
LTIKLKDKCPGEPQISRWKQQIRENVMQKGRTWEESEEFRKSEAEGWPS